MTDIKISYPENFDLGAVVLPPGLMAAFTWGSTAVEVTGLADQDVPGVIFAVQGLPGLRAWALEALNTWRGARRAALGLTSAVFQELVYTGKVLECQRWLAAPESGFGLAREAAARGLSNEVMAALVMGQWSAWQAASDAIEAAYIAARGAVEAAADEAEVAAVLAGLEWG